MMGADGAFTLLLSTAIVILSGGLSWLLVSLRVLQVALNTSNRVTPADWIMVLGKRLLGSTVTLDYAVRLNRAAALAKALPRARVLLLGGYTSEGPFSEAAQGKNFLIQRGLAAERIHCEDGSRHTLENLQEARELLGDEPGQLLLVTSRFHLARSQVLAAGLGLDVQLCAAEPAFEFSPAALWRILLEGGYLHWYWVGRYWSSLTGNKKSLARIR